MNPIIENDNESPFDLSKYRVKTENNFANEAPKNVVTENQNEEPFDLNKYKVKEPPGKLEEFGRHATRIGARVGETILGFPGDVIGFAKSLPGYLPEVPSFLKKEPNIIQKTGKELLEKVPSSEEIKQFSSYLSSGFTDPQSANEELGDELTSLATVLVQPSKVVSGFPSLLKTIGSSLGKAIAVKGAGKAAESLGASEATKAKVELGTLFLTGLLATKTADKFVSEKYQKARSLIPEGTMIETKGLSKNLSKVEEQLAHGLSTPTKSEVQSTLSELSAKASGGAMKADELVQSLHDINEKINSKKLFGELSTSQRKLLKTRYDLVKNEVHKEIAQYGKSNPEFIKEWREANEGFATIAQSKKVSGFLQSKLGKLPPHIAGSIAIDLFLGHPVSTGGLALTYSAVKSGELLYRISKSPTLRDHYMKVILEAGNENLPGVVKNLEALNKASKDLDENDLDETSPQ